MREITSARTRRGAVMRLGGTLGGVNWRSARPDALLQRLPTRAPLDKATATATASRSGAGPVRRPAARLAAARDLSTRCVRLLEPNASAAASNFVDFSTSSTTSTARESPARLCREWTQLRVCGRRRTRHSRRRHSATTSLATAPFGLSIS